MAKIDSQLLFLTTSPRTPEKMIDEIALLINHFAGQVWNVETQRAYMEVLREEDFFHGEGANDPAFSARDRINRAPKSLGFVELKPCIKLTPAGERLLCAKHKEEVFLRQMLKFQIPSPYHQPTERAADFCIKPYLEILRLIRNLGSLEFDELQIFGLQLTNYRLFDSVESKIRAFRRIKEKYKGNYKLLRLETIKAELYNSFKERIEKGNVKTRENADVSLDGFLNTQVQNTRDYSDACFRYLLSTGIVSISREGKSLFIAKRRIEDVDHILNTVEREPKHFDNEEDYISYLGAADTPALLTDDLNEIEKKIELLDPNVVLKKELTKDEAKEILNDLQDERKTQIINKQIVEIKKYEKYDDILAVFRQISDNAYYDTPLMFEWNIWRAMTMLDGGNIRGNFVVDDNGMPLSAAPGNVSDIVCDYGDFIVSVEVTLSSGQRQYEMEGEPVSRHLGKIKRGNSKPCYCLFIAPIINEACVAHFYLLHRLNIDLYGGKSVILPLPLKVFLKMLQDSKEARFVPKPENVLKLFQKSAEIAEQCDSETLWYSSIMDLANNWLE